MTASIMTAAEAVAAVRDGDTVLVGGFGMAGMPVELIDALIGHGAGDLTIVSNNAGNGDTGLAALLAAPTLRLEGYVRPMADVSEERLRADFDAIVAGSSESPPVAPPVPVADSARRSSSRSCGGGRCSRTRWTRCSPPGWSG